VEGDTLATGIGSSGTETFSLGLFDLFNVDYSIVVQPTSTWLPDASGACGPTYTLSFDIP
jgi:hypothetical protein